MSGRDDVAPMIDFVEQFELEGFPHAVDADGAIWGGFGVITQPAWAFVDDDGSVEVLLGGLGAEGLRSRVEGLLAS